MDSLTLNYKSLQHLMKAKLIADARTASGPNLSSALGAFLAERGISETEPIGSTLRASYSRNVRAHADQLRAENQSKAYIGNRKSLLAQWRRILLDQDRLSACGLGRESPFQLALRELFVAGRTVRGTARDCAVPLATLKRWLDGAVPNRHSLRWVPVIESHFALPAGSLTDLLPQGTVKVLPVPVHVEDLTKYRDRLRKYSRKDEAYAMKLPNEELRTQWRELVAYKTALGLTRRSGDRRMVRRQQRGRWSTTAQPVKPQTESNWFAFQGALYVATADVDWTLVSQFLGWVMLPTSRGGAGWPADRAMTLANFLNDELVNSYLQWRIARSNYVKHGGLLTFLTFAASLCNPNTGYLTQSWHRYSAASLARSEEDWRAICSDAFEQVTALHADLKADVKPSRDSFEAVGTALLLPNPLDAVADAVARLDADRPTTGGLTEAIWARDRLLIKLLASNPLRDKNVRMLTFAENGKGHLRKIDGIWRIFIPKEEFKNAKGAAKHRVYDMPVRREVWPDIERYLRDYRPMLAAPGNPYVFVSSLTGAGQMQGLGRRFAILMRKYLKGCDGVGPHAMRHIVATSILKANPNDWASAAWALHDLPETVERHYAHLRSEDAARWLDPVMSGPFSRM